MKKPLLLFSMLLLYILGIGQSSSYYSIYSGSDYWSNASGQVWSDTEGGSGVTANEYPAKQDYAFIYSGDTITLDVNITDAAGFYGLTVYVGGVLLSGYSNTIHIASNKTFNIYGEATIGCVTFKNGAEVTVHDGGVFTTLSCVDMQAGSIISVNGTVNLGGNLILNGDVSGNGTISIDPSATIDPTSTGSIYGVSATSLTPGQTVSGFTWDGESSSSWGTATNWSQDSVPNLSTHDVVIPSGLSTYPIVSGVGNLCRDVLIEAGASVTISANAQLDVSGTVTNNAGTSGIVIQSSASGDGSAIFSSGSINGTIQRFVTSGEWNMITPSTTGVTSQSLYDISANDSWLTTFNETTGLHGGINGIGWSYISDLSTSLEVGTGYNYWPSIDETISFTGTFHSSDLAASITYSGSNYGYNLIGNPFSSAIQWNSNSSWNLSNLELTIWIWNGSQYNSYPTAATHDIPIGQGVFVRAIGASPTLTFPTSECVHGSDAYQKSNRNNSLYDNFLTIYSYSNGYSDRVQISFGENGSRNFENGWDATKMFGLDEAPQLFLIEDELTLSYDHLPVVNHNETTVVSLNLIAGGELEHTISVDLQEYSGGQIILEDRLENINQNLLENPVYSFMSSKDDEPDRFLLHFAHSPNSLNNDDYETSVDIYSYEDKIYVNLEDFKQTEVKVFDLAGRTILEQPIKNNLEVIIPDVSNTYLVVQIINGNNIKTEKVFVK